MPSSRPPPAPPEDRDEDPSVVDEELDTPPEDDAGDEPALLDDEDDGLDELDDGADDPLDDAPSDMIETEMELDPEGEDEDGSDEREADVGPLDEGLDDEDDEVERDAENTADLGQDGDDLDIDEGSELDDGGAEGTGDAPEDEVDEAALPELDADEEGEEGDDELADILLEDVGEPAPLAASKLRFVAIEGAGAAIPVRALSIEGGRLAAAGERLLLVEQGQLSAHQASFGAGSTAVALTGALVLVAGPRASLQLSTDGGERASALRGFAAAKSPIQLTATPGRLWSCNDGALLGLGAGEHPPALLRERDVLALCASEGTLVVLRRTPSGVSLDRLRGDDEGWAETPLPASLRRLIERPRHALLIAAAAKGRAVAITDGASLSLSRDAGARFERLPIVGIRALCFAGEEATAPLLVLRASPNATEAALIELDPRGEALLRAILPGAGGGPAAMVWDPTRGCVWVACEAGLIALAPPPPH
jgi:hypothetical protein